MEKRKCSTSCVKFHIHTAPAIFLKKVQNYINAGSKHIETTESGHMTLEAAELHSSGNLLCAPVVPLVTKAEVTEDSF